jgi:hypothetical protein
MKSLAPLVLLLVLAGCSTPPETPRAAGELAPIGAPRTFANSRAAVQITRIRPTATAHRYEVTVRYALGLAARGEINFGLGENRGGYVIAEKRLVEQPAGEIAAEITLTTRTQGADGVVSFNVNLSEYPHEKRWSPLAGDRWDVRVPAIAAPAPAADGSARVYKAEQVDQAPKFGASVRGTREVLRQRGLLGAATVEVVITAEGKVQSAKVVQADSPEVGAVVAADARNWTFTPALKDGQPVACVLMIQSRSPLSPPDPVSAAYQKVRKLGLAEPFAVGAELDVQPRVDGRVAMPLPKTEAGKGPGSALAAFVVEADGSVKDCKIIEASTPEIADMVVRGVKASRFRPGLKGGAAVRAALILPFAFGEPEKR